MNQRFILRISIAVLFVVCSLLIFRASLDEIELTSFLHILDAASVWILSILCFVFPAILSIFGKEFANRFIVFALACLGSAAIWGIIIERLVYVFRRR